MYSGGKDDQQLDIFRHQELHYTKSNCSCAAFPEVTAEHNRRSLHSPNMDKQNAGLTVHDITTNWHGSTKADDFATSLFRLCLYHWSFSANRQTRTDRSYNSSFSNCLLHSPRERESQPH